MLSNHAPEKFYPSIKVAYLKSDLCKSNILLTWPEEKFL